MAEYQLISGLYSLILNMNVVSEQDVCTLGDKNSTCERDACRTGPLGCFCFWPECGSDYLLVQI